MVVIVPIFDMIGGRVVLNLVRYVKQSVIEILVVVEWVCCDGIRGGALVAVRIHQWRRVVIVLEC